MCIDVSIINKLNGISMAVINKNTYGIYACTIYMLSVLYVLVRHQTKIFRYHLKQIMRGFRRKNENNI